MCYDVSTKKIYIANYTANNILQAQLKGDTLYIEQEIKCRDTISPENVSISINGKYLASANYDGNNITFFENKNGIFIHKWTKEVELAHGIVIHDDGVFATSLEKREVIALDKNTGDIIARIGQKGWDIAKPEFLWPTCIGLGSNIEDIFVSDAHTGYLYKLQWKNKQFSCVQVVGGNAPGCLGLNMPYGFVYTSDGLYLLSTFDPKILVLNPDTLMPIVVYADKDVLNTPDYVENTTNFFEWIPYINLKTSHTLLQMLVTPAYGGIYNLKAKKFLPLTHLTSYHYFIDIMTTEYGIFIVSFTNNILYYFKDTNLPCVMLKRMDIPIWTTTSGIYSHGKTVPFKNFHCEANAYFKKLNSKRLGNGLLEFDKYVQVSKEFKIYTYPKTIIQSEDGKKAWSAITYCSKNPCSKKKVSSIYKEYMNKVCNKEFVLDEALLIGTLTTYCN